jgi:hypothetical protein
MLTGQMHQLQRERDETTSRLAAITEENAQLQSSTTPAELLRLRNQIAVLRHDLAATQALGRLSPGGLLSRLEQDPALKSAMRQTLQQQAQSCYGDLFKELKLTPEQTDKVVQLIANVELKRDDSLYALGQGTVSPEKVAQVSETSLVDLWEQLEPLLGEQGLARLKEFRGELPGQATVTQLNGRLGANQLSDDQCSRLVQILKAEALDMGLGLGFGMAGMMDTALLGTQDDIENRVMRMTESDQHILQQAGSFLTPEQLSALTMVLSNGICDRIFSTLLYFGKR